MKKKSFIMTAGMISCCLGALVVVSCRGAKSGRGFHLPDGDIGEGRVAFVQLGCNQCHSVKGVDLPRPDIPGPVHVELGGEVLRVKTYGQLVTSIISPTHVISRRHLEKFRDSDPMPDFRNTMTVKQMIDVVAFLHSTYTKVYPQYMDYSYPYGFSGVPGVFPSPLPPP